jgi:hypothetical protein
MADTTFKTVLPDLKAVDLGDGTYAVAVSMPVASLLANYRTFITPPTGWTAATVNTGGTNQTAEQTTVSTGVGANSNGRVYARVYGLNPIAQYNQVNWDKKLSIFFRIYRYLSDAESICYFQLKPATTHADLAALGLGIKIKNLAIWGESYGASRDEIDLGVTMTSVFFYNIEIRHDPDEGKIEWFVNHVLVGTQSTAAKIPSGIGFGDHYLVQSLANGATGGVALQLNRSPVVILTQDW